MMQILFGFTFLLLLCYVLLLIYYRIAWQQVPSLNAAALKQTFSTSITVLIPARNEAKNLPCLLQALADQTYPAALFEVIVIDDHSTDETVSIARQYPGVQVISLQDFVKDGAINSYKKKAIEVGITHSKGTLMVTTDADCYTPPKWLETIAAFYEAQHSQMIVMPVAINCSPKPIEIFQTLDFMSLQGITGAAVYKNQMSMCNGANLAYTREAFESVNGFEGIDNIASGDDMLLMHKIAKRFPGGISYLKSADVIVQTEPVHSVSEFFNQRIRWASKADKYDDKRIFVVLLLVYMLNVMLLVIPFVGVFALLGHWSLSHWSMSHWSLGSLWLLALVVKTCAELFFLLPVAKFFNKGRLLWAFALAQPFHIFYTVIAGWLGKFGKYRWKGRSVK